MRRIARLFAITVLLAGAMPAAAQEVVVTGSRIARGGYSDAGSVNVMPATTLTMRRTADFAVQAVVVAGDTRDATKRREEIYDMIRGAIGSSGKFDVQLATGELVVEPLTIDNYKNLTLTADADRDDSQQTIFLIKTPLTPGMDSKTALDRISKFIAAVPAVGRAEMKASGDLTLSVVKPEQYRGQIIDLVAADAAANAAKFGAGYAVDVGGLDRPVQWGRASLTEVFLYLPVSYRVVPKP
jgi:hypothetical protein